MPAMMATPQGARPAGMHVSPELQRAARNFLLGLVAENGPEAAAQVLRDLAAESVLVQVRTAPLPFSPVTLRPGASTST